MHKFNNDWLFYREKIDSISRNKKIIEKINRYFENYKILTIADLGCGTGSNYRYTVSYTHLTLPTICSV